MDGFHLFADVAKYGRTYNRPVERSRDGKPSVGSNSQSVSINENVFQSFNSYAKVVLGNKSVDKSGPKIRFHVMLEQNLSGVCGLYHWRRCVWTRSGWVLPWHHGLQRFLRVGGRWGAACLRDMVVIGFCERGVRGVEVFVDSFEEWRIVLIRSCIMDGCKVPLMILWMLRMFIAPEKDSFIAPPSTLPGSFVRVSVPFRSLFVIVFA
ncbi:hypothetical protein Tco_0610377 [Tanacetum coccineum]